jgi:hypothetical protein
MTTLFHISREVSWFIPSRLVQWTGRRRDREYLAAYPVLHARGFFMPATLHACFT